MHVNLQASERIYSADIALIILGRQFLVNTSAELTVEFPIITC